MITAVVKPNANVYDRANSKYEAFGSTKNIASTSIS